ncbi:FMN-dependent NADH-azoreductase [Acinetobacter halotolerans]|uniref:FMN dependent NADH:quinone oxidoreductase n=1 Tax=Acinetobacter halotolerans TaxID=1752076 RepID=A0A4Q6XJ70_9GAMM|nr:NAD(P)H-dependent oxidoreductase [Acinetobacter halotolerans]RZF55973.1 FMN-dependent NADH-azoreductase [Acinetobacter halotolerans]
MKLLHLDSSALGEYSATREIGHAIVQELKKHGPLDVTYRDLHTDPIPHFVKHLDSLSAEAQVDERILQQFEETDVFVLGAPMYNLSIPTTLKAWIDRILIAGRTFRYTENGPQGLVSGKKVIIVSARGSAYGDQFPMDHQESYLKDIFNFLGVQDVFIVRAEGMAFPTRSQSISQTINSIPEMFAIPAQN